MNNSINRDLAILAEKEILQKVTIAMRSNAGPKRWFWELLQNAIDTIADEPKRKINIKVVIESKVEGIGAMMHFAHDGTPFKQTNDPNRFDDFKNLILPRSGKKTSNTKTVGKFGTGFLSTHSISLKIDVGGVYEQNNGERFKIATTLDRTYFMDEDDKYDSKRIESIINGLDKFDESLKLKEPLDREFTQFSYYLNDEPSIAKVRTGLKDIEQSLPIVMALNSKIGTVHIDNKLDGEQYTYEYGNTYKYGDVKIQNCIKGTNTFSVASISSDNLTLCWPIEAYTSGILTMKDARQTYKSTVKDKMPLVYSTFPMIGSDGLKFPITVHSPYFKPNEKRDGISLTDETYTDEEKNEEIELDKLNKSLIIEAIKLYEQFLEVVSPECENLFYITKINGEPESDWISKSWHKKEVKVKLQEKILKTSMVDVSESKNDRKSILDTENNIQVFFPSLSNGNDPKLKKRLNQKLYIFCKHLFDRKIPLWKDLEQWHNILWADDAIQILDIENVAKEIHENYKSLKELGKKLKRNRNATLQWLNHIYAFIDELGEQGLYEKYEIVPNQKGVFKTTTDLRAENKESKIEPEIVCILRSLNPERDLFKKLVHRGVKCKYHFQERSLKDNIGPEINKLLLAKDNNGYPELFNKRVKAIKLVQKLLSFNSTSELDNSNKKTVFDFSQDIFGPIKQRTIKFYQDFEIDNSVKHIIRLINEEISDSENIEGLSRILKKDQPSTFDWLNRFLNFQIKSTEFENLIHWANVIPNQFNKFKAHGKQEDKERMFIPYNLVNGDKKDELDKTIVKVLKDLSKETNDDWKNILVHDEIILKSLPSKTWNDLGAAIDTQVSKILTTIVEDSEAKKNGYLDPMLTLLDWCEHGKNEPIAIEHLKTTYANKDKLYLQLTYSPENVAVLKDKPTLDVAKRIKESTITANEVEETLDVLEDMKSKLGGEGISDFLRKAEKYITVKENFKNRLETGQNIEDLLKEALLNENINVSVDKSGKGAYDIRLTKNNKEVKLEVKSYSYNSSYDFRFANSQVIEANNDISNYIVCTLERQINEGVCDIEYLKQNLKIQPNLGQITSNIYSIVSTFNNIYTQSVKNEIPLEIPCIDEPRVRVDRNQLLSDSGDYEDLIRAIKQKLL